MDVIRFGLIGLATGSLYAMVAQGLVLVYRGSRLLNFAQAAFVMTGAYVYFELHNQHGLPSWLSLVLSMLACAVLGAAVHLVVLRPMRTSSPLARVIATLGVLIVLYSLAVIRYGLDLRSILSLLPTRIVHVSPSVTIGEDRIIVFFIGLALTALLWAIYKFTGFGRVTTAVAENELTAATLGYSPDRIATINWAVGGALAAFAGVLIAPVTYLEPDQLAITLLIFPIAAALLAGFASFPITLVAALGIGVAQSELARYWHLTGVQSAAPFVVVITYLVLRGRGLPVRGTVLDRLPKVGSGKIRPLVVLVLYIGFAWLAFALDIDWQTALTVTIATAIICLSIVVVSGYAGQLSLAQYVLAGVAALFAAKLSPHLPFIACLGIAVAINLVAGFIFGLPALRTRGITLAIVTFGLGVAVYGVLLSNVGYTGGETGLLVRTPSLFGWNMDPFEHGGRYAFFCLTVLVLLAVAVANLRRGAIGRRLLAVRSNERAAASLGVNVAVTKSYAFMVASGIAGAGGVLLAFIQPSVLVSSYAVFPCITIVGVVVIGGLGSPAGALLGATLVAGGVTSKIFGQWQSFDSYLPLIGGVLLLVNLRAAPDGLFELNRRLLAPVLAYVDSLIGRIPVPWRRRAAVQSEASVSRVQPRSLEVRNLSVTFGGVRALSDVTLDVRPGEVHGLIGPNGAGKTTFIDAVTGFVKTRGGTVTLGEQQIERWRTSRRAHAGLSRSFQSLELFTDLSIQENLAVACERAQGWRYLTDLVKPGRLRLTPAASEAARQFELSQILELKPENISFGQRKVVAIARAVAGAPSVLLLDEPAAGLDDHEAAELADLISTLARDWGIGILLVEHKIDMVMSVSDRVTVLEGGRVLTSGSPAEVSDNPAVIEAYLGTADTGSLDDEAAAMVSAELLSEIGPAGTEPHPT
jgi:ABC-type branched-subunit amino acid transport system ATPase component/branched-subunit amino acid ABC-type transport system permease component